MSARTKWLLTALLLALSAATPAHAQDAPEAPAPSRSVFDALGAEPLLRDVEFERILDDGPVALAVQPPVPAAKDRPGAAKDHVSMLSGVLGEFARALIELWNTDYGGPAGLHPAEGREQLLIVTLNQQQRFDALRAAAGVHDARDDRAFYAPSLQAVVVLDPGPAAGIKDVLQAVRPMCHAAVHALLDAQVAEHTLPLWMEEGMAERLSANNGVRPAKRESLRTFDGEALALVADPPGDAEAGAVAELPLTTLVTLATPADLASRDAGRQPTRSALRGLGAGASLFLTWLDQPKLGHMTNEELKEVWKGRKLAQAVLAGQPCAEALPAILGQGAPASLEEGFAAWKQERIEERAQLPAPVRAEAEPRPGKAAAAAPAVGLSADAPPPAPPKSVESALAVPVGDAATDHARALQRASDGDLRGALAALDEMMGRPNLPAGLADTLLTERRVGKQLEDLRRRWAAEHAGKALDLRDGDGTLRATLVAVEGERLTVKDGGRQRELPLDALTPGTLAAQLFAPDVQLPAADDEARALAWLLAADATWKDKSATRSRKESGPDGLALLQRRTEVDSSLRLGRVVAALDALASAPPPCEGHTQAERDAWLARAGEALAGRELPVVVARLATLRVLAGNVLDSAFNAAPLEHLNLHAKVESLADGRVRARWDFSDAAQLRDFSAVELREADLGRLAPLKQPAAAPAGLAIEGHQLVLRGRGQWRCALPLAAPLTATCELQYKRTPADAAGDPPGAETILLRLCADAFGNYLEDEGLGQLAIVDKLKGKWDSVSPSVAGLLLDTWYQVRLEHDGKALHASVDDVVVSQLGVAGRLHGFVELLHDTDRPIAVRLLVLEGLPDLEALAPVRDAWVAEKLAALGAGP